MDLYNLLYLVFHYESSIYFKIKEQRPHFKPIVNYELKVAIDLWYENRNKALDYYGHISDWNTRNIVHNDDCDEFIYPSKRNKIERRLSI
jgi:hypothetical protein